MVDAGSLSGLSWQDRYFEEGYLRRWRLAPAGSNEVAEVQAFLDLIGVSTSARILDIGCGHGRYAVAMAKLGARVIGLDRSMSLLSRARSQADHTILQPRWVRGDMRHLPFRNCFDAALVIDAFGYFDTDGDDADFLRGVRAVLRLDGRVLMRNPNGALIRSDFRASEEQHREGLAISIQSVLDEAGQWLEQHVTISDVQGIAEYDRRQRIYSAPELELVLKSAGFAAIEHYADSSGNSFHENASPRMITAAQAG